MSNIIFIGTVHADQKGKTRLLNLLRRLEPDIVTVEMSEEMFQYFGSPRYAKFLWRIRAVFFSRGFSEQELEQFYAYQQRFGNPFEASGAREYCESAGIPCLLIDLFDEQEVQTFEHDQLRISTQCNLAKVREALDAQAHQKLIEQEYRETFYAISKNEAVIWHGDPDVGRRDVAMAETIKALATEHPEKKIVHIGGTKHTFSFSGTLFTLLKDFQPERYLLDNADRDFLLDLRDY